MSERIEASLSEALLAQRAVLRRARASAALDARFEQSLATWRTRRVRAGRRRRSSWALAAAAAGVLIAGTAWLVMHIGTLPAPAETRCCACARASGRSCLSGAVTVFPRAGVITGWMSVSRRTAR